MDLISGWGIKIPHSEQQDPPPPKKKAERKKSNGELRFSFSQTNHQMFTSGKMGTRNYPRWVGNRVLVV